MRKVQLIVVGVSAVGLVAALGACSDDNSNDSSSTTTTGGMSMSMSETSVSNSEASVIVDGTSIDTSSKNVVCTTTGDRVVIAIGSGTGTSAIGATLTTGDNPEVQQVGLGATNGVALGWVRGVAGGDAKATKDGKTYKITGDVPSIDMSNPTEPSKKSFEIKVTCP